MSACTEADKPLISIVMAIYHPRMEWLIEQLDSLNAQTYPNLELIICDDGPDDPVDERVFMQRITAFPWKLVRNKQNLGSNKTFERLTAMVQGVYIAYCDQDDVWRPEKLFELAELLEAQEGQMAYSDMAIIDAEGRRIANSLQVVRPRLEYLEGNHLAEQYFFHNCTAGCSMLVRADVAKAAIPFPVYTVCDHWISLVAAQRGIICFVAKPLLDYRQHGHNQTGILLGVTGKESYREKRLCPLQERLEYYQHYGVLPQGLTCFVEGRITGRISALWKYRAYSKTEALFEIGMRLLPEWVLANVIRKLQR